MAANEDLTGTVVFGPNDNATQTVSIATVDDALVEGDETFTVTLSPDTDTPLPDGVSIPSAGRGGDGDDHGGRDRGAVDRDVGDGAGRLFDGVCDRSEHGVGRMR